MVKIKEKFIIKALRNCGYNSYSAISDINDNSLEPEVEASFVKIDFETEGTGQNNATIKSILIIDDGNGMDKDTLEEAMCLGAETGKNGSDNLGMYGAGLKTAAFSIGQKLEVFTKTPGGKLEYAFISLEDAINKKENIKDGMDTYEVHSPEDKWFNDTVGKKQGTIVRISVLDKLSNKNLYSFSGTLKNRLSETFNKFIEFDAVKFYVGKTKVPYVDLMGNRMNNDFLGENEFDIDGHHFKIRHYYLPKIGNTEKNDDHIKKSDGTEYTNRTFANQGLYVYRNLRLVGKGLTLGIWVRDPWKNGYRCELFADGNCDELFGSTFTKMLGETQKGDISQALIDKLREICTPYANECSRRDRKDAKSRSENDPAKKKETEEFYKRVTDKQNQNMLLKANRKGENKKREEEEKEHKTRGPQLHPNPIKNRTNKWFDGFEERPMGRTGEMYFMERTNCKRIMVINTDHPYYEKFYSQLNDDMKFLAAQIISCQEIAKQNVNYYGADEVQSIIDNYNDFLASEVSKSLTF